MNISDIDTQVLPVVHATEDFPMPTKRDVIISWAFVVLASLAALLLAMYFAEIVHF